MSDSISPQSSTTGAALFAHMHRPHADAWARAKTKIGLRPDDA